MWADQMIQCIKGYDNRQHLGRAATCEGTDVHKEWHEKEEGREVDSDNSL